MKKRFFIILFIFFILIIIASYAVYNYRSQWLETQKINSQYEEYKNIDILGTELVSIINKTMDINARYQIPKNADGTYIENDSNSIKLYIVFNYKDETKTVNMESIYNAGVENFIKTYSTASFKCTNIEYHSKTNNIKNITFSEVSEDNKWF